VDDNVVQPRPTVYAGGESEAAEELIAEKCDGYLMHGDSLARVAEKIADTRYSWERHGLTPMLFGVEGYTIVRDTPEEAEAERQRITDVNQIAAGYQNCQQWLARISKTAFRWRITRYRTADRARDWWVRRNRGRTAWRNLSPLAWICCSSSRARRSRRWSATPKSSFSHERKPPQKQRDQARNALSGRVLIRSGFEQLRP
jgi:hypothetical protein